MLKLNNENFSVCRFHNTSFSFDFLEMDFLALVKRTFNLFVDVTS
jgi:hypothetical protein